VGVPLNSSSSYRNFINVWIQYIICLIIINISLFVYHIAWPFWPHKHCWLYYPINKFSFIKQIWQVCNFYIVKTSLSGFNIRIMPNVDNMHLDEVHSYFCIACALQTLWNSFLVSGHSWKRGKKIRGREKQVWQRSLNCNCLSPQLKYTRLFHSRTRIPINRGIILWPDKYFTKSVTKSSIEWTSGTFSIWPIWFLQKSQLLLFSSVNFRGGSFIHNTAFLPCRALQLSPLI